VVAPIPNDGARTIPAALQTLLASRFTPDPDGPVLSCRRARIGREPAVGAVPRARLPPRPGAAEERGRRLSGHGRVQGSLPNRDWTWEAYVSTGQTGVTNINDNLPSLQRYQSLVAQPNFASALRGRRNYVQSCTTGLPIFRTTDPSQNCLDSIDMHGARSPTSRRTSSKRTAGQDRGHEIGRAALRRGCEQSQEQLQLYPVLRRRVDHRDPIGLFASNTTAGSTEVSELYGELLLR